MLNERKGEPDRMVKAGTSFAEVQQYSQGNKHTHAVVAAAQQQPQQTPQSNQAPKKST